ncbi:transcriptional regulator [Streptomyces platensis]|uniref:Helix-turn-helix domain protein n=1 Tax=Streptomyces platensis TaxID=58346 RepID=A0AAE6ND77_STRPT|nr:helix-turn-helix domain-containing protein [Streptomyces platensis]OSY41661.1 Helix-turn-helix domain protein [Streptomyces platensis]QEV50488.1 transcriptional regulator [Streptomyces platensis]
MTVGFTLGFVGHPKEALRLGVSAVAALDEPTRRRLYDHVVRQPGPVSRDEAAKALGLARQTAAFHLDRLADESLLDVVYERRSGRTGPGAGRPAKLYKRSTKQVAVSLPERHYEVAGRLLAQALEESEATGEPVRAVLHRKAHELGIQLAGPEQTDVFDLLERNGFEPLREGDAIVLGNCPFHTLAREHTQTVCGMNLHLLRGVLARLDEGRLQACLEPSPGHCCVRLQPVGARRRRPGTEVP